MTLTNVYSFFFSFSFFYFPFLHRRQGLLGSRAWAKELADTGVQVVAMFNSDMMGWKLPGTVPTLGMKDRYIADWLLNIANGKKKKKKKETRGSQRQRDIETERRRDGETERRRGGETETKTERQRDADTDTEIHGASKRQREKERESLREGVRQNEC